MNITEVIRKKIRVEAKGILKHLIFSGTLILLLSRVRGSQFNLLNISDNMFIVFLFYFIILLFNIVVELRFFDLPMYGFRKIVEITFGESSNDNRSKMGSYAEYLQVLNHDRPIFKFVIISSILITSYFILILINNYYF